MVLDNKNVISVLRKMVGTTKQAGTNKPATGANNELNHAEKIETAECKQDGTAQRSVKIAIDDGAQDICEQGTELLPRSESARQKRKRAVSECASIIADPTQVEGGSGECLAWILWVPTLLRLPCLLLSLYLFISALELLATSFRLMAGKTAGSIFRENPLLQNPVVGLMMGVFFTVLVQSSSTCTSVIVSMVSSGVLAVQNAIPMIMGANIGTSLTNTLVSFSQVSDRAEFERAFSGATVHDCFNWLTVLVLLTIEVCTGYMFHLTSWMTEKLEAEVNYSINNNSMSSNYSMSSTAESSKSGKSMNFLGDLTKPLTSSIMQIEKSVLKCWALGGCQEERLLRVWCKDTGLNINGTETRQVDGLDEKKCEFLMNLENISDFYLGLILFIAALLTISTCLIFIVKLLHSLLQGTVAELAKTTINSEVPGLPWLSGYIAILAGAVLTFLVQSSSVFTSTITPLVGLGLISVDRMYPLTLGSNIGTTTTALLASLSADPSMLRSSVQIALCHLTFNIHGILLFYPLPVMRWPLAMCKVLGRTTARYRWFAIVYLLLMFVIVPGLVLVLSIAGSIVLTCTLVPSIIIVTSIIIINILQNTYPTFLPSFLSDWNFLPECLRSLEPMDRVISRIVFMKKYSGIQTAEPGEEEN